MSKNNKQDDFQPILFFRFGEIEHVKSFVEHGRIYMNPIAYFKNIEGDLERTDKNENITGLHQADGVKIEIDGRPLNGLTEQVTYYIPDQDQFMASHIFCMSHLFCGQSIRDDNKIFDDRVKGFGEAFAVVGKLDVLQSVLTQS